MREETRQLADAVNDELGKLDTETNPRARGKIMNKAHKKTKKMRVKNSPRVLKPLKQSDVNYRNNIQSLEDKIDAKRVRKHVFGKIAPKAAAITNTEISDLKKQAQEIKNYNT